MWIKGLYKLPEIKHAFFIVSSLDEFSNSKPLSKDNKKRKEYFAHILQLKDRRSPKKVQRWTLKIMSENDFLKALQQHKPRKQVLSNQPSHNPECLELLAINLLKTPKPSRTFHTPKVLCNVPDEDIIEVFI